jgi:hypothetical protein
VGEGGAWAREERGRGKSYSVGLERELKGELWRGFERGRGKRDRSREERRIEGRAIDCEVCGVGEGGRAIDCKPKQSKARQGGRTIASIGCLRERRVEMWPGG